MQQTYLYIIISGLLIGCSDLQFSLLSDEEESGVEEASDVLKKGAAFQCQIETPQSSQPLLRISKSTYTNALRDGLTEKLGANLTQTILSGLGDTLVSLPGESVTKEIRYVRMDQATNTGHFNGYIAIARKLAALIANNAAAKNLFYGACITDDCLKQFISSAARFYFRRPISVDEVNSIFVFAKAGPANEAFQTAFGRVLTHPEFLLIVEDQGEDLNSDSLRLSSHEIASRLALVFWNSFPNQKLREASDKNMFSKQESFNEVLDTIIFNDPRTTTTLLNDFFKYYLRLDQVPSVSQTIARHPELSAYALDEGINVTPSTDSAIIEEPLLLVKHHIFDHKEEFKKLLLSRAHVSKDSSLSQLYGMSPADTLVPEKRTGLFSRAAFLASSGASPSLILRGVHLWIDFLGMSMGSPPPLNEEEKEPATHTGLLSTREKIEELTSRPQCAGCHSVINPLGFSLANFDSLGRDMGSEEKIYTDSEYIGSVAINTQTKVELEEDTHTIENSVQLHQLLASSELPVMQMLKHFFRYSFSRLEDSESDGCSLKESHEAHNREKSVLAAMKTFAQSRAFTQRRIVSGDAP